MLGASAPPIGKLFVAGVENPSGRHPFDRWRSAAALNTPLPLPSDLACIMYTSGTTGPPKGVLMPHAHCYLFGLGVVENLAVSGADHYHVCLPLSHANGLLMQLCAVLIAGARATVRERFSASAWLRDIRASGATITHGLGCDQRVRDWAGALAGGSRSSAWLMCSAPNHPDHERA